VGRGGGWGKKEELGGFGVFIKKKRSAGLRAAIESSALGAKTALVYKSMLGKAHTVSADGRSVEARADGEPEDNCHTQFRDTMKGVWFSHHCTMAQLHAREAPDSVGELEREGAVFDRTKDGRILQLAFGGHSWKRLFFFSSRRRHTRLVSDWSSDVCSSD